uniref:CCHC-type domain-containing protein n=1 Tax=Trichuris muris TaxID=70415 RepID=A0A5S6Q6F6_TRIMR
MSSPHAQSSGELPGVTAPTFSFDCPESWSCFEERLEFFFEARRITDALQRRAVFLTVVCNRTYELLRALAQPNKVNTLTYSQLVDLLRNHFDPRPNEILQRYHFYCRVQKDGESVNDFVAELRRLSAKCNFGHLDEMLRDRLVCGIRDEAVQRRLFAEKDLDFATAFSLAQDFESARNDVCVIRNADRMHVDIEKLGVSSQPRTVRKQFNAQDRSGRCSRCGDSKHQKDECPFRRARCRFCQRIGHIEQACLSKEDAQAHMVREETDQEVKEVKTQVGSSRYTTLGHTQERTHRRK